MGFEYETKAFKSMREFYESLKTSARLEKLNETLYSIMHTIWLSDVNYKREICGAWRAKTGMFLSDADFVFLRSMHRCFADRMFIELIKRGERLRSREVLWQAFVGLETDLALIDAVERDKTFSKDEFRAELEKKYYGAFDKQFELTEEVELPYIKDFAALGRTLQPHKSKIKDMYDRLLKANEQVISERIYSFKRHRPPKPSVEKKTPATEAKASELEALKAELEECKDKIWRLESDVNEYKRQRDEQTEYAQTQYDRGVRDVFKMLNNPRYGNMIDYFHALSKNDGTEKNLRSCLENFFMALEELDIVPIETEGEYPIVETKSPGWRLRNMILDKPTRELE